MPYDQPSGPFTVPPPQPGYKGGDEGSDYSGGGGRKKSNLIAGMLGKGQPNLGGPQTTFGRAGGFAHLFGGLPGDFGSKPGDYFNKLRIGMNPDLPDWSPFLMSR